MSFSVFEPLLKGIFGETLIAPYIKKYITNLNFDELIFDLEKLENDQGAIALLSNFMYMKGNKDKSKELYDKVNTYEGYVILMCIFYFGSLSHNEIDKFSTNVLSSPILGDSLVNISNVYGFGLTKEEKRKEAIKCLMKCYELNKENCECIFMVIRNYDQTFHDIIKMYIDSEIQLKELQNTCQNIRKECSEYKLELEHYRCKPSLKCEKCGYEIEEGGDMYCKAKRNFEEISK